MKRKTYLEIDLDAYRYNINVFRKRTGLKLIGIVKANAYGAGAVEIAKVLQEEGTEIFGVSSLEEALELRKAGFKQEILLLGFCDKDYFDIIRDNNLSIVTVSMNYLTHCGDELSGVKCHLKLNTGMNRLGVKPEEAEEALDYLLKHGAIVEGVMSHFATADGDQDFAHKQYSLFKRTVMSLSHDFKYIHMSATDGSIIINDNFCTHVRIGLGLLGHSTYDIGLRNVMSLYSHVTCVKKLSAGETVSYGRHYTSDGEGYILTLPLGYADGWLRANRDKEVYVENEKGRIVGSVCMDQLMVLTKNYHGLDAKVEFFGNHISLDERAKELGTISYEIISLISDRVARKYKKGAEHYCLTPRFK